jgi:histidine triad (HIT) family protein
MATDPNCIFCKIIRGEIPARKVYEDEEFIAFHDIRPAAPVHILLVPKLHVASLQTVDASHAAMLGRMMVLANQIGLDAGCRPGPQGGFRVVINNGVDGGQEVDHLHMHIMGGPRPWLRG